MPDHAQNEHAQADHPPREFDRLLGALRELHQTQHEILRAVTALHTQGVQLMAISQEVKDGMAKVDDATTKLAARFQALADRLTNDPTPEETAAVAAELSADADRLNAIGADPTNPVPVPIPPVAP